MIRLFAGYDPREAAGFSVFTSSVIRNTSRPVSIAAVRDIDEQDGSNAFTYARFRVPALCDYTGWALFMDGSDQLVLADLAELWAMRREEYAVQVVKHDYRTRHPIKYKGTSMECPNIDYPRKNWASVMLINCAADEWRKLPAATDAASRRALLQFRSFPDDRIGALPATWNLLVDEGQAAMEPRCLHWTAGIPGFERYHNAPFASNWFAEFERMVTLDV